MSKSKSPKEKAAAAEKKAAEKAVKTAAENEELNEGNASEQNGLQDDTSNQNGLDDSNGPAKKVAIVIPYLKSKSQGSELLLAIRSISRNFKEKDYQLVIIGDYEDWFSEEILFIDKPCIGSNPQADVIDKIKTIILDESICDEFIWTNDDIYFVSPTTVDDIRILKTDGILKDLPGNAGLYNKNRARTIKALQALKRPIRNFATHMPVLYDKEKMMDVFEVFSKQLEAGLLLSSAYFNLHFDVNHPAENCNWEKDHWSLRVVSNLKSEGKKELFRKLIVQKHFLNHSEAGYSKLLIDWLFRQFPEKCRFEK